MTPAKPSERMRGYINVLSLKAQREEEAQECNKNASENHLDLLVRLKPVPYLEESLSEIMLHSFLLGPLQCLRLLHHLDLILPWKGCRLTILQGQEIKLWRTRTKLCELICDEAEAQHRHQIEHRNFIYQAIAGLQTGELVRHLECDFHSWLACLLVFMEQVRDGSFGGMLARS